VGVRKGNPFKLDDSVRAITTLAVDQNTRLAVIEIQTGDGVEKTTAIPLDIEIEKKKKATLIGILGEVDAGWKLFPFHTIRTMKRTK
jgi:hypothetical protein